MRRKVAEETRLRQQLQASEARFRSLIEQAPVAIGLYVGRELRIEVANQPMMQLWSKGEAVLGKRFTEALPELAEQPFPALLEQVFATGIPYEARSAPATLLIEGRLTMGYFDFTYHPVRNADGEVYAVMDIAVEVTQEVLLRQQYEQTRQSLEQAVDLSQLGIWTIDLSARTASFSQRVLDWAGVDSLTLQGSMAAVDPDDFSRLEAAFKQAQRPESGGQLDVEYRLMNARTGQLHLLHSMGQTTFDQTGHPVAIYGVSRDITQLRATQLALENQVHEGNAANIKAKVVAEGANGPTTNGAEKILIEKGVIILPDLYLNAGGVTVSYFEWLKNLSNVRFGRMGKRAEEASLKRLVGLVETTTGRSIGAKERDLIIRGADEISLVRSGLEDTMIVAYHEIREVMKQVKGINDMRTAAFYAAIEKVGVSYQALGIFP
ncbi:MAG: hypothetical protein EOO39_29445 [Cytophagaceae bacterium]|nr:MAG: hypothetical protein EOO39_29445 [Cytophagaceae bacterium]